MQTGKIRLYRGPLDGKVLRDNPYFGQPYIVMSYTPKFKRGSKRWYEQQTAKWDMMHNGVIGGYSNMRRAVYRRTGYMHPDGSIFYEWDQPKKVKK